MTLTPTLFIGCVLLAQILGTMLALTLHDWARGRRGPTPETPVGRMMQARAKQGPRPETPGAPTIVP